MHKPLSLRQNFSWTLTATIIESGCQYLLLMIMAKLLPKEEVGYYVLALLITNPVMMFTQLQLRSVQVTDVKNEFPFSDYLGLRLLTNLIAAIAIICIIIGLGGRYEVSVYYVIFIVLINKAIQSTSDISFGVLQKHERLDRAAQSIIAKSALSIIVGSAVLFLTKSILICVFAIGLSWAGVLFWFDRYNISKFQPWKPRFKIQNLLRIVWIGLPLGIARGIIALNDSTPGYFIEGKLGPGELAIFSAMAYTGVAANHSVESLGYSAANKLAQYFVFNRKAYIKLLLKMNAVAAGMAIATVLVGVLFGKQILTLAFKAEYAKYPIIFVLLLSIAGGKMISSMLWHGLTAAKQFHSQLPLSIAFQVVCLIGCWLLVPRYGLSGAVMAMILSIITRILGSILILVFVLRKPFNQGQISVDNNPKGR